MHLQIICNPLIICNGSQPLWKVEDAFFRSKSWWQPPWMHHMILTLSVLVILAYSLVLKFQGWFDIHLRHLLQAWIPVTKTCVLTCNNGQTWVTVSFGVSRTRNKFVQTPNHPTIASKTRGVHSLLYFAYTCVRDLFIGGVIYLAEKIIRWW